MTERNAGLDFLKIAAMYMVVLLHTQMFSGMLDLLPALSANYLAAYLIESFSIVAVNCFILISGYFLVYQQFKLKKLVVLWAEIIFYSYLFLILAFVITPGHHIGIGSLVKSVLPVISGSHWFITCYIMLYCLFPFINKLILALSRKELNILLLLSITLFAVWGFFIPPADKVSATGGYNIIWMAVMYLTGAFIRIRQQELPQIKPFAWLCGYILPCLITFALGVLIVKLTGKSFWKALNYNSIFVFAASVSLFMFFKGLKIPQGLHKIIFLAATTSLGVFLVHSNIFVRQRIEQLFPYDFYLAHQPIVSYVFFISAGIFVFSALIGLIGHKFATVIIGKKLFPAVENILPFLRENK